MIGNLKIELHSIKRLLLSVWVGFVGLPMGSVATDAFYINSGNVTIPPQIDATNFVNEAGGTFNIVVPNLIEPFDTSNTENFTNKGSMTCFIGWRFDTAPSGNGLRRMAKSFRNHPSGTITSLDGGVQILAAGVPITFGSKLVVSATNLINEGGGLLTIDSLGLMSLEGKGVNLNRGRLQVLPLDGLGLPPDFLETSTNFIPDSGILDNYWGIVTNNINSAAVLTFPGGVPTVRSPQHQVQFPLGFTAPVTVGPLSFPASFVFTNAAPPATITTTNDMGGTSNVLVVTNISIQAAFVSLSDPNIGVDATFFPSTDISNLFSTITVRLSTTISNPVTGVPDQLNLFLLDRLASETNRQLQANVAVVPTTFKPSPYFLLRTAPFQYFGGAGPNSFVRSNLLFDSQTMSNATVRAVQLGYSATADIVGQRPAAVPGGAISNIAGRVLINADTLDLTRTRLRADSWVSINTAHLISSSNAIMDAVLTSYDLGSTNGTLRIKDLALASLKRFGGDVFAWSGVWTNTMRFVITNNYAATVTNTTMGTNMISVTNYVLSPLTNFINIGFHTLILDARAVTTTVSGRIHDLITRSTNVVLNDPAFVTNSFYTDAQRYTIEGTNAGITFGVALQNWSSANAPNLLYFTNTGTLSIPNEGHFGDDRPLPYAAFVNQGNALGFAAGIHVRSDYFENSGSLTTSSLLDVQTVSGTMENGSTLIGGDLRITAQEFKFQNYSHQSQNALVFTITNILYDSGPGAAVQLSCQGGFNVNFANATGKPQAGDLLGTTLNTFIPNFFSVLHTWPGDDRGASASGFVNNLAVGKLVINAGFFSLAEFAGTGVANGLYVDVLDLSLLSDYEELLQIDPNLVIYFASAKLSFTPPPLNGVPQLPEEFLDGQFGGRLRWVRDFAGPNSSVDVVLNGSQTIQVNKALRNSKIIDSDGDGLANFYDFTPFDGPPLVVSGFVVPTNPPPSKAFAISWLASPSTVYQVEFTTNPLVGNWQSLLKYTNNVLTNRLVTVCDTNTVGGIQRFYRVGHGP